MMPSIGKRSRPISFAGAMMLAAAVILGPAPARAQDDTTTQTQGKEALRQQREAVEAATDRVRRALVRIHVVEARYDGGRSLKSEASGSGVIVSPDGYVVTNHHVAGDAVRLFVTMPTREEIPAELVGTDPMSDIAVIKLTPEQPRRFEFAEWGDSDALRVGDSVLAMGSPLSLSQSVTQGIVSNTAMTMPAMFAGSAFELDGENVGSIVRWIGHDAAIYPGNSGGPLVNLQGKVIGINEISMGLSGAIPGNLAREVARQIVENEDHEVSRAFLGLMMQPVFKHSERHGAVISDVVEGSPADKAGVKTGDLITRIGQREIAIKFAEELPPVNLFVASLPIGKPVEVGIVRDGKQLVKELTPERREKAQHRQREFKQWGLTGRDLSIWVAIEMQRKDKNGMLVTSVGNGGPAGQAKPALQANDVITAVEGRPVNNMADMSSVSVALTRGKEEPTPVLVTFDRDGEQMVTVVKVGVEDLDDPGMEPVKAWIPVATQVVTQDLKQQLKLDCEGGVRVTQLYSEDPAKTLGLEVGDLILELDGEPIPAVDANDVEVFPTLIRQYPIGTEVTLSVVRGGKPLEIKGKLATRPKQPREMPRYQDRDFDFTAREVAYIDRMRKRWTDAPKGLLVESVEDGGWAALGRLAPGDLLMAIDGQPVGTVEEIKQAMTRIKEKQERATIFTVRRGIHNQFLEMEPLWKQDAE